MNVLSSCCIILDTLLKINILYCHCEEPLPSIETFNCTKGSLKWKKIL